MPEPADTRPTAQGLLGSLEHQAMSALWADSPATVGDVLRHINGLRAAADQLAYTTVMTVLTRLAEKGLAGREKVGRGYAYTPTFNEPELIAHLSRRDVADLLDRYGGVALTQFAAALREADADLLARVAELAEKEEPNDG